MVVGGDPWMALGVVADVDEHLDRVGRDLNLVEELAGAGALLVAANARVTRAAIGVSDCVGAALGDRCEKSLRGERPVDARLVAQAVSRNSAHEDLVTAPSDGALLARTPLWVTTSTDDAAWAKFVRVL